MPEKLGIVVPTRNRKNYLQGLFVSILELNTQVDDVVVVDSTDYDNRPSEMEVQKFKELMGDIKLHWIFTDIKSASIQRNIGVDFILQFAPNFVTFLDDDTRPRNDYLSRSLDVFRNSENVVGVSGVTNSHHLERQSFRRIFKLLFKLGSNKSGRVLDSGINLPVYSDGESNLQRAEWLFGCSTWRSHVFSKVRFPSNLTGGALCEDVIFSLQASTLGELIVDTHAMLDHLLAQESRPDIFLHTVRSIRNRFEVVKTLRTIKGTSFFWFWWSVLGIIILNSKGILSSLLGRKTASAMVGRDISRGIVKGIELVVLRKDPI
jgi:glycosyltransferase involved in cell wall biosynthesis